MYEKTEKEIFNLKKKGECEWGSLQENNKITNRALAIDLDIFRQSETGVINKKKNCKPVLFRI